MWRWLRETIERGEAEENAETRSKDMGLMKHRDIPPHLNELTDCIIKCAIEVHSQLGPGFLERFYEQAFEHELKAEGLRVDRQHAIHVSYKDISLGDQILDLVIESQIVVELKAVEKIAPVHLAQLVSYLHAGHYPVGLLVNFHVSLMRDGIYRRINARELEQSNPHSAHSAFSSASPR